MCLYKLSAAVTAQKWHQEQARRAILSYWNPYAMTTSLAFGFPGFFCTTSRKVEKTRQALRDLADVESSTLT